MKNFIKMIKKRITGHEKVIFLLFFISIIFLIALNFFLTSFIGQQPLFFACEIIVLSIISYFLLSTFDKNLYKTLVILALYTLATELSFGTSIENIFRSDYWLISNVFYSIDAFSVDSIKKLAFFEMQGDIRFQPLAHLLMFIRYLVFANHVELYHILNMSLHVIISFCIFKILLKETKNIELSFLLGLLFIVLPSQFDTISWTYHIYIVLGVLCALISILLVYKYAETHRFSHLAISVILAFLSLFLYEPVFAFPALLIAFVFYLFRFKKSKVRQIHLVSLVGLIGLGYLLYFGSMYIGLNFLTSTSTRMSMSDLFTVTNIIKSIFSLIINIWESSFLKNIGVSLNIQITDIVYLNSSKINILDFVKILLALFLFFFAKVKKKNLYPVVIFLAIGLSYFSIISLGRSLSNDLDYIVSQPRYQYFLNAFIIIVLGSLLYLKFYYKIYKNLAMVIILFSIVFFNSYNTISANQLVFNAMPMNRHYSNLNKFFNQHPNDRLFINFKTSQKKIWLGMDYSLDVLFEGQVTKFLYKATYLYNGQTFKKLRKDQLRYKFSSRLSNFYISFKMHNYEEGVKTKVGVIGSEKNYPMISIAPDEYIEVALVNAKTNKVEVYKLKCPYHKYPNHSINIIKIGNKLKTVINGKVEGQVELKSTYKEWQKDGVALLGQYYRGARTVIYLTDLYIELGVPESTPENLKEYSNILKK